MYCSRRWKLALLAAGTVAAFLPLSLPGLNAGEEPPALPHRDFSAAPAYAVVRIVSGDTLILGDKDQSWRVGLAGVQSPPLSQPHGAQARAFLDNLLRGEAVYAEYTGKTEELDTFGRRPAYLFRAPDGLFVNLELVRQGYAESAAGSPRPYGELFTYYARRARDLKKGMWAEPRAPESAPTTAPAAASGSDRNADPPPDAVEVTVFVTPSGQKYHRAECYHLRGKGTAISLAQAKARGYQPCSRCKPPP
jgi:micrococcal nuclease